MGRFVNSQTGVVVSVADHKDERFSSELWSAYDGTDRTDETQGVEGAEGYDGMKVPDLKSEIERRNEGRDEADRLPSDGRRADLIVTLQADDASRSEQ